MFVNPDVLKTATFLIEGSEPVGTVFFVRVPRGENQLAAIFGAAYYAVTTAHSVREGDLAIRFNLKSGGTYDRAVSEADWIHHPETDVSILPLEFPLDDYNLHFVNYREFVEDNDYLLTLEKGTGEQIRTFPYKEGDEVYTVGLFEGHPGQHLAQPVVRFGHLALKPAPGEKILVQVDLQSNDLVPIDAFLVEMATWPGQSGSPVFLRIARPDEDRFGLGDKPLQRLWELNWLVGMVQGSYLAEQDVMIDGQLSTISPLNLGIGIVIPAQKIVEVLMASEIKIRRDKDLRNREAKKIKPTAASSKNPFTKQGFENALRRASSRVSEPESKKTRTSE